MTAYTTVTLSCLFRRRTATEAHRKQSVSRIEVATNLRRIKLLLGSKTLHTNPQLRQRLQILLVATSDRELPSSPHAEHIVARGAWMNLLNQRRVHQNRSMNP